MSIDEIVRPEAPDGSAAAPAKRGPFGIPIGSAKIVAAPGKPAKGKAPVKVPRNAAAVIGGVPRVSLLPPELEVEAKRRAMKGKLVVGVVVIAALVGGGVYEATSYAATAQAKADAAQAEVTDLNLQIGKYAPISRMEASNALGTAAERVGSSTQIDWQKVIGQVEANMPADYQVSGITIAAGSPIQAFSQSAVPLQNDVVGSVTMIVRTTSIEDLPAWLIALRSVKGYSDASPAISSDGTTFTVTVIMHLTDDAYITPLTSKGAVK